MRFTYIKGRSSLYVREPIFQTPGAGTFQFWYQPAEGPAHQAETHVSMTGQEAWTVFDGMVKSRWTPDTKIVVERVA